MVYSAALPHSAQKHGLLCEVDSDDEDKEVCEPFFAHCKAHSIKEIAKRKVMSLSSMYTHDFGCLMLGPIPIISVLHAELLKSWNEPGDEATTHACKTQWYIAGCLTQ